MELECELDGDKRGAPRAGRPKDSLSFTKSSLCLFVPFSLCGFFLFKEKKSHNFISCKKNQVL